MLSNVFLGINAMTNVSKSKQNKFVNHLVVQVVAEQMVATHMKPWSALVNLLPFSCSYVQCTVYIVHDVIFIFVQISN